MNAENLRALQAPLKELYRTDPSSATITLRAEGSIESGMSCAIDTGRALVKAGLHPATGGTGALACSGDMLLHALVACAGVTMAAVASAIGVELRDASLTAEGEIDVRGTLGISKETPVGFTSIRMTARLDTDATDEQIATLMKLTERYCVVLQSLRVVPTVVVERM
jgi:uncharacterized OsmC-like protein